MSHTITHHPEFNLVKIAHPDEVSPAIQAKTVPEVAQLAKEHQCLNILSDVRTAKYSLSETDEFAIAQHLAEIFLPESRIAVLLNEDQIALERIRLLEQTAELNGIHLKLTSEAEEVISWLQLENICPNHSLFELEPSV